MRKALSLLLVLVFLLSLAACGAEEGTATQSTPPTTTAAPEFTPENCNTQWDGKTLRVLCIGNSFARNATKCLYDIAEAEGVEEIVLGVLHIGGCTVEKHWNNAQSGAASYTYYKNTTGTWESTEGVTLLEGLQDENWDVITITQGQGFYGIASSYDVCLEGLIAYAKENATNPDAQIAFHMTWAFPPDSTNERFDYYANNQEVMFQAITTTARDVILTTPGIDFLLPSGTAIQNVRGPIGEQFFKDDGYHLNAFGEYVAGYMWYASLTGQPLTELKYKPAGYGSYADTIRDAVNAALDNTFEASDISK